MGRLVGVIGGSGFIGTWLVGQLLENQVEARIIDVKASDRYPQQSVIADVSDHEALLEACRGCDVLYNLAAEHRDDVRPVDRYQKVNVTGAANTCSVATALGIDQIIFTSTVAVYGLPETEVDETAPTQPFNDYGRTKLAAEQVFSTWAGESPERSLCIIRPTVVFGPGNRGNVYLLLKQIASGRPIVIGSGTNKKSMAYVGNVAACLVHALSFGPGIHIYNYVDKPDTDMNGLVNLTSQTLGRGRLIRIPYGLGMAVGKACDWIAERTGQRFPISAVRVRKYAATTQFAAERITSTGFIPRHSLRDALITTIHADFADQDKAPRNPAIPGPVSGPLAR